VGKARKAKVSEKELGRILEAAARAWTAPGASHVKGIVAASLSTGDADLAVANVVLYELGPTGESRRALYALVVASAELFLQGEIGHYMGGAAWEQVFVGGVRQALAESLLGKESPKEERPRGNND
jgi:hypothetical protein